MNRYSRHSTDDDFIASDESLGFCVHQSNFNMVLARDEWFTNVDDCCWYSLSASQKTSTSKFFALSGSNAWS